MPDEETVESDSAAHGAAIKEREAHRLGVVFWTTVGISAAFVLAGALFTKPFNERFQSAVDWVITNLGWLYLMMTTFFLVFVLFIAFSRYGKIKLGAPGDKPEFKTFSWFAMLFQAGMGIGILFWGVGEPLLHYNHPPYGEAEEASPEAANLALQYAFFHWTLHPWAIYAVVGLAVGYFSYRRGQNNLQISSVLHPVLGDRIYGPVGKGIDILAIFATLSGVAVSLGAGTLQIDAGLHAAFGTPTGTSVQLGILALTAVAYMLSASTPLERGIQTLSNLSMVLAFMLLIYFIVVGPTLLEVNTLTEQIGIYTFELIPMSLRMNAFNPDPWLGDWTIFFWSTWIAWAPYVGSFIARISRGRTIRQFVLGVLFAPSLFTMIWFAVFGAAGIDSDRETQGAIGEAVSENAAVAMFEFLEQYPLATLMSGVVIFLVFIFFVAGADAGTVVLGSMSTGGVLHPRTVTKLTWGVIMAGMAGVLLVAGGLDAIQNGAIIAATPFGVLMLLICWSLVKALKADNPGEEPRETIDATTPGGGARIAAVAAPPTTPAGPSE